MEAEMTKHVKLWRDRFYGRQDVYGYKRTYFSRKQEKMVIDYTPSFREHNKNVRKAQENTTPAEEYVPLSNEEISKHIRGSKELMMYVLQPDRTIKFAAVDFDLQYTFEDVLRCYKIIKDYGVECAMARSTTKGHHIYMFFDDFLEAMCLTSWLYVVYCQAGFVTRQEFEGVALPETYPKTTRLGNALSTGLGIKPPMQGTGMKVNMNCWVDEENKPIGGSGTCPEQWDYFEEIEVNSIVNFKKMLIEYKIEVKDVRISETRGLVDGNKFSRTVPYEAPLDGDFKLIIEGCPMLNKYWNDLTGEVPHYARVAMTSWAMQTANGLEMLREKWAYSKKAEQQIQYAIETHQQPWTCAACRDHEICIKGVHPKFATGKSKKQDGSIATDYCFNRVPPKETINGQLVVNPQKIPEDQWPLPSPVRLRKKFVLMTVEDIKKEIDEIDKTKDNVHELVQDITNRYVRFKDNKKKKAIHDYLKEKKLIKVRDLLTIKKEAEAVIVQEVQQKLDAGSNVATVNGTRYALIESGGYLILHTNEEGEVRHEELCNFQIVLEKDINVHSMIDGVLRELRGHILCMGKKTPFKIETQDWNNFSSMTKAIGLSAGPSAVFQGKNLDKIRECSGIFGMVNAETVSTHENHGWDSDTKPTVYRSSEWNITKEGLISDDEHVNLSRSPYAMDLSLKDMSHADFAKVIHVLKNDLIRLQEPIITMTVVAHSLQAAIGNVYLESKDAPVLWIQGITGSGKTTIAKIGQRFYGTFNRLINVNGTVRSIEMYTMVFKDALLVVDDFKEEISRKQMIGFIQKTYDRSGRTRLQSNLAQRKDTYCRGLVMVTAEDRPSSEASVISRCIYIEAPTMSTDSPEAKKRHYKVMEEFKDQFSGVTAKFIHYMMINFPEPRALKTRFDELESWIIKDIRSTNNSNRLAKNLAANFLTWSLFCDFLSESGVMTEEEHIDFIETHKKNIIEIRDKMVVVLQQEVASAVFIDTVKELLVSGKAKITGLTSTTDANRFAPTIGYITSEKSEHVYLLPKVCLGIVKTTVGNMGSGLSHGAEAIGKQMVQMGLIKLTDDNRTQVRRYWQGVRSYVWCLDRKEAGLGVHAEKDAQDISEEKVSKTSTIDPALVDPNKSSDDSDSLESFMESKDFTKDC